MAVGKTLKEILSNKNMTVKELAAKSGVSVNTLYAIIQRDNLTIKPDIAQKICEVLEIDESILIKQRPKKQSFDEFMQEYMENIKNSPKQKNNFSILEMLPLSGLMNTYDENLNKIAHCYGCKLNDLGRQEAAKRIEELTHIPKYTIDADDQNNSDQQN